MADCGGKRDNSVLTAAFLIVQPWGGGQMPVGGSRVRDMFGPGVRAEAPVLSAVVALLMAIVGTLSIAIPLALAIIVICS